MPSDVSVVVPTLGTSPYLESAVESALAEQPAEVIVVVNGGARVEVEGALVVTREEPGRSAARNEGVTQARTPYVAFLDDDDEALPGRLARQREPLVRDVDELAAALGRLRDDPDEARRLGEAGRRRVEEEFSEESMTRRVLELYDDAVRR